MSIHRGDELPVTGHRLRRANHPISARLAAEVSTRGARRWIVAGLVTGLLAAGCSQRPACAVLWHLSRSPKLTVHVGAGCPAPVAHYHDVVNTFPGPPLVPGLPPTRAVVCWYHDVDMPSPGALALQVRLDRRDARTLATAVRGLSLRPPPAVPFACPADIGTVALIGFSYSSRPDVALWYDASGCQTLDNGRLGSFQGANPSFYVGFEGTINRFAPPSTGSL